MMSFSERERSLMWEDLVISPEGKPLGTLGEVLDAIQAAWSRNATLTADLARVTAERDTLQLTIDAIECKLIAFDDEAIEYADEGEFVLPWMASVNGKGESFETAVQAFVAVRSASKGGSACTPDPTS
jgi:hypothetical protein